jgi:hypothetical protein
MFVSPVVIGVSSWTVTDEASVSVTFTNEVLSDEAEDESCAIERSIVITGLLDPSTRFYFEDEAITFNLFYEIDIDFSGLSDNYASDDAIYNTAVECVYF